MKLYPLNWQDSENANVDVFIGYVSKLYPEQITPGETVNMKTTHNPASLDSWINEVNTQLPKEGTAVTTINLDGKTINSFFQLPHVTYIGGFHTGRLIVINEGVLLHDNPTEERLNSRKTKIGMHELLENILTQKGIKGAHNLITHYIMNNKTNCVNDQDMSVFFKKINIAEATTQIYDHAREKYCSNCENYLAK